MKRCRELLQALFLGQTLLLGKIPYDMHIGSFYHRYKPIGSAGDLTIVQYKNVVSPLRSKAWAEVHSC